MILVELVQMSGTDTSGKRHVFPDDEVFRVTEKGREKVGFVRRQDGARFSCIKRLTDDELDALLVEVNEARKVQGRFGPVTLPKMLPPSDAALAQYIADNSDEDDDDDSDD